MSKITAVEVGRKLQLTVGDGDDAIVILVPPVRTSTGSALLALWAGIAFAQTEQPLVDAENLSKISVGEENWDVVDELRSEESALVINAAMFWNIQGGGIDLVQEMLRDGLPKARETLAQINGLGDALSALQTLLSGGSEIPTPSPAGTPATSTPIGTYGSFGTLSQSSPPDAQG